jgi:hypothetical protein
MMTTPRTPSRRRRSSSDRLPISAPLIDLSRSPSPYARKHASPSAGGSAGGAEASDIDDDEGDREFARSSGSGSGSSGDYDHAAFGAPLLASDIGGGGGGGGRGRGDGRRWTTARGAGSRSFGPWLFSSGVGWTLCVALLSALAAASDIGLILLNRLILWSMLFVFYFLFLFFFVTSPNDFCPFSFSPSLPSSPKFL